MAKLTFAIAVKLLADEFKKGVAQVKSGFSSIQAKVVTFAAALGALDLSFSGFLEKVIHVTRETNKAMITLKNTSGSVAAFTQNLRFANDMAKKYGIYINDITMNFAKFTAAATMAGMSLEEQQNIFESLTRASVAFGFSADETNRIFLAITQMIGKGKVQAEELRGQLGERMPIAMQAMAKAAGVSVAGLDKLMKEGKIISAEILPGFAKALDEILPNVDTDNIETSLSRLKTAFKEFTDAINLGGTYKGFIDTLTSALKALASDTGNILAGILAVLAFGIGNSVTRIYGSWVSTAKKIVKSAEETTALLQREEERRKAAAAEVSAAKERLSAAENAKIKADEAKTAAERIRLNREADRQISQSRKELAAAEKALTQAQAAEDKVRLKNKEALEKASAFNVSTFWGRAYSGIKVGAAKLWATLKGLGSTMLWGGVLSIVTLIVTKFIEWRKEGERIRNIFSDYKKEMEETGSDNSEIVRMQSLQKIMNDRLSTTKGIQGAQAELQKMLGMENGTHEEINKRIAQQIELIKEKARAEKASQIIADKEARNRDIAKELYLTPEQLANVESVYKANKGNSNNDTDWVKLFWRYAYENGRPNGGLKLEEKRNFEEYFQNNLVINDAQKLLEDAIRKGIEVNPEPIRNIADNAGGTAGGEKSELQKAEEEYARALRELNARREVEKMSVDDYNKSLDELNRKFLIEAKASDNQEILHSEYLEMLQKAVDNPLYDEIQARLKEIQTEYNETVRKANEELKAGLISQEEYKEAIKSAAISAAKSAVSIEGIGDAADGFVKAIRDNAALMLSKPVMGTRDTTFDYKKSDSEKLSEEKGIAQDYLDALNDMRDEAAALGVDMTEEINAALLRVTSLDEALKLAKVKEDVQELTEELNKGMYSGIKDIASNANRLSDAFERVGEVLDDPDATGWERIMAVWEAMTNMIDGFMSIIQMIENLTRVTEQLEAAKQAEMAIDAASTASHVQNAATSTAADIAASNTKMQLAAKNVSANTAEGASEAGKSAAKLPFPANIVAIVGAISAALAAFAMIPKFKDGGIVSGGNPTGDHLLARVNSGEMILNGTQQARLFKMLDGKAGVNGTNLQVSSRVEIKGTDLKIWLSNVKKKYGNI